LVVFGATGFTGRLVAEVMARHGGGEGLRWALAGRSRARLGALATELGLPESHPLIEADAGDAPALRRLAARARAVITTVGPYQLGGEALLQACITEGTHYLDLCGEPAWMAAMIRRHDAAARARGARIVFSCGFDSVPFDLGVLALQRLAQSRTGRPLAEVQSRVLVMKGGYSGGTAASLLATLEAVSRDPQAARDMADPFSLAPGFRGPPQPAPAAATFDDFLGQWSAPFVMAPINTKNVHRTHALLGYPWGEGFVYGERMACGGGTEGELRARGLVRQDRLQNWVLGLAPGRALLRRCALPKPGEGPGPAAREAGRYEILASGIDADGRRHALRVTGRRDPGYGATSRVIVACARTLLAQADGPGGLLTPGAALGLDALPELERLAELRFVPEPLGAATVG
ncbi:MAG: saccharopine dehydrogenase family protein, partial [Betaproteobacteria bacterium]